MDNRYDISKIDYAVSSVYIFKQGKLEIRWEFLGEHMTYKG